MGEPEWQRATKSANERVQILFENDVFYDVVLKVEEKKWQAEFPAHMLILAMTSPVFADDFYGENSPKGWYRNPVVKSLGTRFTIRAVEAILRYAYSCPGEVSFTSPVEAMETYRMARAYKMDHLQEVCSKYLQAAELFPEDAVLIYEEELHTEILGLREKCFDVLEAKPLLVMRIAAEKAKLSTITDFLEKKNMVIPSELHLLRQIKKGAEACNFDGERRDKNLTNFLRMILPSIRFLSMSNWQFIEAREICGRAITDSEGWNVFKKLQPFKHNEDRIFPPWLNTSTENRMGRAELFDIPMDISFQRSLSTSNYMFKRKYMLADITARKGNFVFTGIWIKYKLKYPPLQVVRCTLNARNKKQKIAFELVKSFRENGRDLDKRLPFKEPLTVLQGETAQLILGLDHMETLTFFNSERTPGAINIGFDLKIYDQPIAISKLEYRPLYL